MSNRKARLERRVAKRKAAREAESERLAALEKFGPAADERRTDRRKLTSEEEMERKLKELGITDRRRMDRRGGGNW